jgi:Cdc6-like AAA superfamily ATPase
VKKSATERELEMSQRTKRGSSRRKGDEFQDLTALRIVLELYISGKKFRSFLEYEKNKAIDDIVTFSGDGMHAVQAKYAVDPLAVYVPEDFTDTSSRVCFSRLAEGWRAAKKDHPGTVINIELLSNRGRDSKLENIIEADGCFAGDFIESKVRKESKSFRDALEKVCGFAGANGGGEFQEFLRAVTFRLNQRPLSELQQYIEGELLDHQLGISDRGVFHELKEIVKRHAIEIHAPITDETLDAIFKRAQSRFLVRQVFPVEHNRFVEAPTFKQQLQGMIEGTASGYIVVTGLPGSGKSTSLSEFFDQLENDAQFVVFRYYCFVNPNDDAARLRLEAEALRVNLLSQFHAEFSRFLERRHDYSERQFSEVLKFLGEELSKEGRKLVVLLDGLDHAERDVSVRDSVLRALPTGLPSGVLFVVGTQELKNWDVPLLKEGREKRHIQMPLFSLGETTVYLRDKHGLQLDDAAINAVQDKSQGLPLYLRYVAEWLVGHGGDPSSLNEMPEAGSGDIRDYYDRLWSNMERDGMAHARYLCGVLVALRFPVAENEIADFQTEVSPVDVPLAVRAISHLLRRSMGQVSIFHDSFRVFVNAKLNDNTKQRISTGVAKKLQRERGSARWFTFVFRYSLQAGDCEYVISEVNRPFVDFALEHCRPASDIYAAIEAAGHAAARKKNLVALARLGSLDFRTTERIENQFDYSELARVQLALGRVDEVLQFCCRPQERRWLVNDKVAMRVMIWCADTNRRELGEQLFSIFCDTHSRINWTQRYEIELLAQVVGIYSKHPSRFLLSASARTFNRDILEAPDTFSPGFAPHLESFLGTYFRHRPANAWKRLKRIKRLFPNHLVRHLLLRLVVRYASRVDLRTEVEDYLANTPSGENLEVAAFAVLGSLPVVQVRRLAGQVRLPPSVVERSLGMEAIHSALENFGHSALILGYEDDFSAINRVTAHIGSARTIWSGFLRFQLSIGLCLGRAAAGKERDTFEDAVAALNEINNAGKDDEPQKMEVLRGCRPLLVESFFQLTRLIAGKCPERLDSWRDELLKLRGSEMWTSHWGISEITADYSFELKIWERLTDETAMRSRLLPILKECAQTYAEKTTLKAGSRCDHFLWLATIAAKCGWRTDAEEWRKKGVACSLTYGYHKDITLDYLVDVLELLNPHEPQHGLQRCASILEMEKWMRQATDDRETTHFKQSIFPIVSATSREAAFALIRFFREYAGRWQMLDCLEKYVEAVKQGDLEVLWTLKDAFTPHFVERGRHPQQVIRVARHLFNFAVTVEPARSPEWQSRFTRFVQTHFDPGWWPADVCEHVRNTGGGIIPRAKEPYSSSPITPRDGYVIEGVKQSQEEIKRRLELSVDSFCRTVESLCSENDYFHDRELVCPALLTHMTASKTLDEVKRLAAVVRAGEHFASAELLCAIGHRLIDLGDQDGGFAALLAAYQRSAEYHPGSPNSLPFLIELCQRDHQRMADFLVERCQSALRSDYGGYDIPRMVARFYAACGDIDNLRKVFSDYLQHCEELFTHLPHETRYSWLYNYHDDGRDESEQVVELVIDLLGEPEIDQARRLLRVLTNLAKVRPELVCRICCHRLPVAEPLLRERLESLLVALASLCAKQLAPCLEQVLPLFALSHFRLRMSLANVVRGVAALADVPASVRSAAEGVERAYSHTIAYPSRRLLINEPTSEFIRFFRRGVLFDLHDRLDAVAEILETTTATILGFIERRLGEEKWDREQEEEQLKEEWRSNSFDDRRVWFIPAFHQRVSEILQEFVHRTIENGRYHKSAVDALWGVLRISDPEFLASLPSTKPSDILALNVNDATVWLDELRAPGALRVEQLPTTGWTTVFEERRISQTHDATPQYEADVRVRAILVAPELSNHPESWPTIGRWMGGIPRFHSEENVTVADAQMRLSEAAQDAPSTTEKYAPITAFHANGQLFHGHRWLVAIHPVWMARFGLKFDGMNMRLGDEEVVCCEEWQEGYEDEVYSRDLLSTGIRLRIKNSLLRRLLAETQHALAVQAEEKRTHQDSHWKRKQTPDAKQESICVFIV